MAIIEGAPAAAEEENKEALDTNNNADTETIKEEATPKPAEPAKAEANEEEAEDKDSEELDSNLTLRKAKSIRAESRSLRQKNKTLLAETETLKARLAELEGSVLKTTAESLKAKYGLTDRQAKYITGETPEDMEKSAAEIAEDLGLSKVDFNNLQTPGSKSNTSGEIASLSDEEILKKLL